MHLASTERQQHQRAELRSCFRNLPPQRQGAAARRIGAEGRPGLGSPVEYRGQGPGADEHFAFLDETHPAGAPVSMVTLTRGRR
ncbi:hypothetical protein ABZ079_06255 [Streptomyces sp. NPDC006314]|uniref:hypothetical protein n=1 Tax=Streptomyces sp. NPDC006314 TaxID=3154475 RepID=UPI0033A02855